MKTRNEKILLVLLLAILFVAGNFYGYDWLSQKQHALDLQYKALRADKAEALIDLQQQDLWAKRKKWIDQNQPTLTDEGDAKAQVLGALQKGAHDQHLDIIDQKLDDVEHGASGTRISVTLKVQGSMQGLVRWLAELEKPKSFYAISKLLSLTVAGDDPDSKSISCRLQLARYFKAGS